MKTKHIPVLLAMTAGVITCIISFLNKVSMMGFIGKLCLTLVVFFFLGTLIRIVLDKTLLWGEDEKNGESTEADGKEVQEMEAEQEEN